MSKKHREEIPEIHEPLACKGRIIKMDLDKMKATVYITDLQRMYEIDLNAEIIKKKPEILSVWLITVYSNTKAEFGRMMINVKN